MYAAAVIEWNEIPLVESTIFTVPAGTGTVKNSKNYAIENGTGRVNSKL